MKLTILLVIACAVLASNAEEDQETLRLISRSRSLKSPSLQNNRDEQMSNRRNSISSVTVQLHLNDDKQNEGQPQEQEEDEDDEDYAMGMSNMQGAQEDYMKLPKDPQVSRMDSDSGANNGAPQYRFLIPPEGFMNSKSQMQYLANPSNTIQFVSTPAPPVRLYSTPASPSVSNQIPMYSQHLSGQNSNIQYVATPAPPQFTTSAPRIQYMPSMSNYPQGLASQIHYASTPAPESNNYGSNSQNIGSQGQSNNLMFVSTPAPRTQQFASTQSPAQQFLSQLSSHQQNQQQSHVPQQHQQVQYLSTPAPSNVFVSTPVSYLSSPAPSVQYSTGSSPYNNRLNSVGEASSENQMHIVHFDNAMTGVRTPQRNQQNSNIFVSSTPEPSLASHETPSSSNEDNWRTNFNNNINQLLKLSNNQNNPLQQFNNHFTNQLDHSESGQANQLVLNVHHPKNHFKGNYHREVVVEKEKEQPQASSDFGWKLNNKKPNTQSAEAQISNLYSLATLENNNPKALALQSNSGATEYHPFPDNPFLNHISFPSAAPSFKSAQNVNIQNDNSREQNVNLGYSIGFGQNQQHETLKADQTSYSNKFPFISLGQGFTTASSLSNNDVVKGIQVSQVNSPKQNVFFKDSSNPQEFASNTFKTYEKIRNINSIQDNLNGNNGAEGLFSNGAPYQLSQGYKQQDSYNVNHNNNQNLNNFNNNGPKNIQQHYQNLLNSPSLITAYASDIKHDNKVQPFKWTHIGSGVEVSGGSHASTIRPIMLSTPESVTPNPVLYLNNDIITNSPVIFSNNKEPINGKIVQSFDHANAMKNIQPIDLTNVLPYSASPLGDGTKGVTLSPQLMNNQQNSYPSNLFKNYPGDQSSELSQSNNNLLQQSFANFLNNYKPVDQSPKDKDVVYSLSQYKPQFTLDSGSLGNLQNGNYYLNNINNINKPREISGYESNNNYQVKPVEVVSPNTYIFSSPPDMSGHSSNIETRQVNHMEYVPSDAFRNNPQNSKQLNVNSGSGQISQFSNPDYLGTSSYHHFINHPPMNLQQFDGDLFRRLNQQMGIHQLEPSMGGSEQNFRFMSNKNDRQNSEELIQFDKQNNVEAQANTKQGPRVINPYNMNMKIVNDILNGKQSQDESRMESIRDQFSRFQDIVNKNEQSGHQLDSSNGRNPNDKDGIPANFEQIEVIRLPKANEHQRKKKKFKNAKEMNRFRDSFGNEEIDPAYHTVSNLASEQLHNTVQVLTAHQIGAVIDQQPQGLMARVRSQDGPSAPELDVVGFDGSEFVDPSSQRQNEENQPEENQQLKDDVDEPYPLLTPPKPPNGARQFRKKHEMRPVVPRRHRMISNRGNRPKSSRFQEEFEELEPIFSTRPAARTHRSGTYKRKMG